MYRNKPILLAVIFFVFLFNSAFSQETKPEFQLLTIDQEHLPVIQELNHKDPVFLQYEDDVQSMYRKNARKPAGEQYLYGYRAKKGDTLFSVSARCNIPYETIALVNQLTSSDTFIEGKLLILPCASGLFIPDPGFIKKEKPLSALEALVQKAHGDVLEHNLYLCYTIAGRIFCFLPGERFSSTERAFFLDSTLKLPVRSFSISSPYGVRQNPFGNSNQFHKGIDLACPEGTEIYSCKSGTVLQTALNDPVYGNYVLIKHDGGITSFYAHLSSVSVKEGSSVQGGQFIGRSGQSGKVTGPHLHFEIRMNGRSQNPGNYIEGL